MLISSGSRHNCRTLGPPEAVGGPKGGIMHQHNRVPPSARVSVRRALTAGVAAAACCLSLSAVTGTPALAQAGLVSPTPVKGTPTLVNTGTTEQIRQLVDCGGTMYAVGTFTEIKWNGTTYARNNAFSFSDRAPFTVTSWNPDVNGTVNSIAFNGSDCSHAYLGGQFTSVNGTTVANLAEVTVPAGAVVSSFGNHTGGGHVDTILGFNGHLLVGGTFTSVDGNKGVNQYYASLNPTTGKDDGFLHLGISGHIVFPGVKANSTEVFNQQLSHSSTLLLAEG